MQKCFAKFYNLNGILNISFNDEQNDSDDIIVKDQYFEDANIIIEIEKKGGLSNLLENNEKLYLHVKDNNVQKEILNFKLIENLKISKIEISAASKLINQ